LLCAVAVAIVVAVTGIGPVGASVSASVRSFLFDWEQRDYNAAAAMTTGQPAVVASSLRSVYRQLGAQGLLLTMGPITVHGNRADASFYASFDLGRGGLSWHYTGRFKLRRNASGWRIVWSPSVIVPGLAAGDRLAVLTTMPARAVLLDAEGHSLIKPSSVVQLGVYPDQVTNPLRTSERLARVTGLAPTDADEMSGQIEAWPPRKFLELVQLRTSAYGKLRGALRKVPGLQHQTVKEALFDSDVPLVTGQVATETAKTLIADGEPYRPGTTVGLSGLEQAYQAKLAGKPKTQIVLQNPAGKQVKVLYQWPGTSASAVRTTIDGGVQQAAHSALSGVGLSAAIVAVRAGSGQILAVDRVTNHSIQAVSPFDGRYQPGQAFTIVSTAALLAARDVKASTQLKCPRNNRFSGQLFSNTPAELNLGTQPTFRQVFAHACSTEFAALSLVLTPGQLTGAADKLGIGGPPWKLPLPTFPGHLNDPGSNSAEVAAETIGTGSVLVSPLDMALVAGAVESGTWSAPLLVSGPKRQSPGRLTLSPAVARQLRDLMRSTVKSGAATAANVPGARVFGQVGSAKLPGHHNLRAVWFVGFRGTVAFTVVVFARSANFAPAVQIAGQFASGLPSQP
jgi:cell division protein FtsI/penicillin-binding protein 2